MLLQNNGPSNIQFFHFFFFPFFLRKALWFLVSLYTYSSSLVRPYSLKKEGHLEERRTPQKTGANAAAAESEVAFVWPHAQKVNAPQRNVCCQGGWGKGGSRERRAACCAGEVDVHHEASYADATIAARR
jgi:hypothetical protein